LVVDELIPPVRVEGKHAKRELIQQRLECRKHTGFCNDRLAHDHFPLGNLVDRVDVVNISLVYCINPNGTWSVVGFRRLGGADRDLSCFCSIDPGVDVDRVMPEIIDVGEEIWERCSYFSCL